MNYPRLALASLGALVAFLASGFISFAALPGMKTEFKKHPTVYRPEDQMNKRMPVNMLGILLSIVVVAILYAKMTPANGGIVPGLILGTLIGIFAVCIYVVHNYAILNISLTLALYEGTTYFIQWLIVGIAIGLIYKP